MPVASTGDEAIATVIPYRNKEALISYYLGLFSLIAWVPLLGVVGIGMAIAALILGVTLAGPIDRRRVQIGLGAGALGLVPFGGLNPALALVMLVMFTVVTWSSIKVLRRLQTRAPA